jgi:hypothetical protein
MKERKPMTVDLTDMVVVITGANHVVDGGWTCNIPRGFEF